MTTELTHLNGHGEAHMVDVGGKPVTRRQATACGEIQMSPGAISLVRGGRLLKGDVLAAARIAGIMAAKKVDQLIPLCHSLSIESAEVAFEFQEDRIRILATVGSVGKTGVEMEALTAVSVAALTLYDMTKAIDKTMTIGGIYVERKSGGRSGLYEREQVK